MRYDRRSGSNRAKANQSKFHSIGRLFNTDYGRIERRTRRLREENMETKTYDFYEDSGHGWLKVSVDELQKMNLVDKISNYSYRKGCFAYLEEDCDAELFIRAMEGLGIKVQFRNHFIYGDSPIRYYDRFKN
jgi:hypothetical protein